MGKKESLNPFDYKNTNTQQSTNPFDYKDKTPIEQDFNIGNTQAKIQAEKEFDENINAIMDKIPELNKEERSYLMKVGKSGQLTKQEIQSAIDVMRGADVKQQQYRLPNDKGGFDYVDEATMLQNAFKPTASGEQPTMMQAAIPYGLSKISPEYYMKDNGRGVKVPVPLAKGELPEAGFTVESVWGTQRDAEDDNRIQDIGKKVVNLAPKILQGFLNLEEMQQGLVKGDENAPAFNTLRNTLDQLKFKTSTEFDKGVVDMSKVNKFSDLLEADTYDFGPDKLINTSINVGMSIAEFLLTRKVSGLGGAGKLGGLVAGTAINSAEPLQAAQEIGLEGRNKYAVALPASIAMGALDAFMGVEGMFNKAGTEAKRSFIKQLIKENVKIVDGKVTKESLDELFEQTLKKGPGFIKRNAKNIIEEPTQEVLQNMTNKSSQIIYDNLVKDDPEAVKYNTKMFSPESIAEYINDAVGGILGGAMGNVMNRKQNKQSESVYSAIKDGKEDELKVDLASSLKRGKITQDEYDRAIFKIDSYKEYYDATVDKPIDDESKRKIFDLTYEKQNLKSAIETLKEKNPNGINDPFIAQKEAELKDITNQVNEIWTKANPSSNPVARAKAEVPAWRVSLNDFATEIKNPDKTVSQKLKTKADILKSTGIDTSLNKLAKAFNIEFKTPRVPEESGPIQVKDGILYEPYMTEKTETKDSELKTRGLPVFAFEDKDGGTWLFAAGEQTKANIPDTSYLIKLNEDGSYEGHEEFHYETPKMNMLSFDDIPQTFTRLGLRPVGTAQEVKGFKAPKAVAVEEIEEEEIGPDETLYNEVFADVKAGRNRGKLTALPNNTFGVIVNGRTIPFASSAAENSYTFKENFPEGDVEVGIEARENIPGYDGTGLMVVNLETGAEIGYLRATEKSSGKRKKVNTEYDVEQSVEIPTTLTDKGQEVLDKLKADSDNYQLIEDENGRRYVDKSGKEYKSVSSYLSGTKSGGNFKGDQKLKEAAFKVGRTIDAIVDDFFNGTIKPYSEYSKIMSKDDYNDVVKQLDKARKFATDNGFSIITEPIVLADEKQGVAGSPNIIMVDKDGGVYIYDTATIRNPKQYGRSLAEHFEKFPNTRDRISNQVNLLADILKSKHGIEAKRVGFVPFEVDYTFKGGNVKITSVKQNKRYDIAREVSEPKVEVKQGQKQPLTTEEVTQYMQGEDVKFEQGMKENEFEKAILDKSENPAQIAAAYLTAEVSDVKAGESLDVMDAIYTFFKNGNKLSKEAFDRISDPNFRNKLDLSGLNSYVATKGGGENLDSSLLTDNNEDVTPEKVAEFISSYPKGFTQYEKVFTENNLKNKLAAKFKQLTGRTLTEKIANQLAEAMYGVQMQEETKTDEQDLAKEMSAMATKAFLPEDEGGLQGKDISGFEGDVAFQKSKKESQKANVEKIVDRLQKSIPGVKVVFDETIVDNEGNPIAGKWNRKTKTISINPYHAGLDTPIHEFGHILIDAMGDNRVVKAAINQLKKSDLWRETAERYHQLNEEQLGYEVLAEAIGREGAGIFDDQANKSKLRQYLEYIYDWFKTQLGLNKNVAKSLAKQIIGGIGTNGMVLKGEGVEMQKEADRNTFTEIAKSKVTFEAIKKIKSSVRAKFGHNSYVSEVIDEISDALNPNNDSLLEDDLAYIAENGISYNKIANLLIQETDAFDSKIDALSYLMNIGEMLPVYKDYLKSTESLQKVKKQPKLTPESYYNIEFGGKTGITLSDLNQSVIDYEAMVENNPEDKTAARKLESAKQKLDEFERAYKKYSFDYNKLNKLKAEKGNLDGKSFDELVEIYNIAAEFDPLGDNSFLNDVKYRIAYLMAEDQRKFLESKGHSVKPKAFNDIKGKDVFMKSLAHMTEAFPEMQYLSKAYDAAVREMNMERREKQMKLDALAKSVAKEESKTLGLKMKDFLTGKAYEFFKWMDKNGELISTEDAYKLSKAKGDYVKFYREIREEYKDLQENTPAGYDENALLMTDKNFAEKLSSNGIVSAIQSWLGTNSGMRNVVMNYTHSDKRTEPLTLAEIEVALQNEANKGLISAAVAAVKSIYYNTKAKKLINKGVDEEGNDISHLKNQGDYMLDKKGKLVNKFGTKRPDGYDYSKDFHAAMVQYLADMTWTKHMQPLIPMVESVEQYSKATGATKGSSKNLAKWIESWKKMHIYKERPDSKFPELDMTLKFLRKMTSWTKLAFNLKASVMNLAIGEYNNWKEVGGKDGLFLKGHTRLLATTPSGKKKFSNKAYNFLTKNGFVATDYDEMPTARAGQLFTYLGMGSTKAAEYVIQGSLALGQIPNNIWKDINSEGEYVGSDPNIKEKIEQWRTKVSDIHGKYSAKDRRNFELYEFGKFVGQFKTWIPDWWKERFGDEYIDQYGKRHKGTYRGLTLSAINELRKDIVKPEFWTSDKVEYVNARKNLKAALVFGTLLAFQAGGDDDKKRRKKADMLTQAIGNLTFIFDPEQAKYMLKTPFAGMSYANDMLNLMTDLSTKNVKAVTPYAKLVDVGEMFED